MSKLQISKAIDMQSNDNVSIYEKIDGLVIPSLRHMTLEVNSAYKKLFDLIDTDNNNQLESTELKDAAKNKIIKKTTSKYIVKHSSEWDKTDNMADILLKLITKYKDEFEESKFEEIKKYYENQIIRVDKLTFFSECKRIEGFPSSDKVYHVNPVGLVGEFEGQSNCTITGELLEELLGKKTLFNHSNMKKYPNVYKTNVYEFAKIFNKVISSYPQFDKCIYIAHFLAQSFHEADHFLTTEEYASGWDYDLSRYPSTVCISEPKSRKCRRHNQIIKEGNTTIGDGPKYKGKGLIQLTWKGTYKSYSDFKSVDFVSNPTLIASNLEYAIDASCYFWTKFKGDNYFNKLIDAKEKKYINLDEEAKNDLVVKSVTKKVNGGTRGLSERQELFRKIIKKLKVK